VINLTISFSNFPHLSKKVGGVFLFNFFVCFGKFINKEIEKKPHQPSWEGGEGLKRK
jgi:hypothetical protein